MERSIGFERSIQPKQFESLKVSSFVSNIPFEQWKDEKFIDGLYKLLTVQGYKALMNETSLVNGLKESGLEPTEYLAQLEKELLDYLKLDELQLETKVEKE